VAVLSSPGDPIAVQSALVREWDRIGNRPIAPAERRAMALAAAGALAGLATSPDASSTADLARIVPQLQRTLHDPALAPAAASALAVVPTPEAQRSLADLAADSTRPVPSRVAAARALRASADRFGRLISKEQRPRLLRARDYAQDPGLRQALDDVAGVLLSLASPVGGPAPGVEVAEGEPRSPMLGD
jgi:hypothetical protein